MNKTVIRTALLIAVPLALVGGGVAMAETVAKTSPESSVTTPIDTLTTGDLADPTIPGPAATDVAGTTDSSSATDAVDPGGLVDDDGSAIDIEDNATADVDDDSVSSSDDQGIDDETVSNTDSHEDLDDDLVAPSNDD